MHPIFAGIIWNSSDLMGMEKNGIQAHGIFLILPKSTIPFAEKVEMLFELLHRLKIGVA